SVGGITAIGIGVSVIGAICGWIVGQSSATRGSGCRPGVATARFGVGVMDAGETFGPANCGVGAGDAIGLPDAAGPVGATTSGRSGGTDTGQPLAAMTSEPDSGEADDVCGIDCLA